MALRQWAADTNKDLLWLHVAQHIATAEQFWLQLHDALSSHLGLPNMPPDDPDFSVSPISHLTALLKDATPFTLILEDFHWVQGTGVAHGLLRLLKSAPELSNVITARSALAIEQAQISGYLDLRAVGPTQLQFSPEEALEFHAGTVLEPISNQLNERLLGKPTLHKAARRASEEPRQPTVDFADDVIHKVSAVMHREIVASLDQWMDEEVGAFMAATLNLMHFDLDLVRVVAPDGDVAAYILLMEEIGFLESRDSSGTTLYEYPTVFKDILSTLLSTGISACRSATLAAAAAHEFDRESYLPAFVYALDNNDFRLGSSVLVRSGLDLLFDPTQEFSAALKKIPNTQIVKYPLLALTLGVIYIADKRTRFKGLEYFALALTSSKLQGKSLPPEEKLAVNLAQAVSLRLTGQFKLAAASARSGLKDLAELPLTDRDQLGIFESIALGHWGLSLLFVGDFSAATRALHLAVSTGERFGSRQATFFATALLAYRYAVDGDLQTAAKYAEVAQATQPDMPAVELYQQTPLNMALALIELGKLNPDAAATHLDKVISETSTSEFWGQLRVIESRIELLRGHAGMAAGRLELALLNKKELPALNPVDANEVAVVRAELLMAGGNATGAQSALSKLPAKSVARTVAQARVRLGMGRPGEVVELLGGPLRFTSLRQALEAQILLTVARLHLQPAALVRADIERISSSISVLENQWPLVMLSEPDLHLLLMSAQELGVPWPHADVLPRGLLPHALSMITLTPRERSILGTLVETGDRAEIARLHFVSVNTVKSQLRSLYKKLGVASREEALLIAHQEHLLKP
ncbi:hypothetical protein ART_1562 [Arthrobacter sp. PAMC 25486]|uniref:LuxR C-terminal-related transcriptional regulator n=1 Tax=Arthrobacter sp. PAMC 25486 TaxID=1494608 RepID=UPI000535A3FB|nr:LuxR C-terminal-related transcriptional regulator [Arthrobacter sp. PAMC 25486]AIY01161.1 hypothetical protein ART_1562 [Arthrobacter sp. PAMC 25486]